MPAQAGRGLSPPALTVEIKALACGSPATLGLPLSRLSVAAVARQAERSGLVARISDSTVWRWLHEDAIRPWQHRCWIFPRDPHFQIKAERLLDLHTRTWQGRERRKDEFVLSTGGCRKSSIRCRSEHLSRCKGRRRWHPESAPKPFKAGTEFPQPHP